LKPHTPAIPDNNLIGVSVFLKVANECKKLAGLGAESLSFDSLISQLNPGNTSSIFHREVESAHCNS